MTAVEPDGGYTYPARDLPPVPLTPTELALPVKIFHLPHPSGASTWLNVPANRALLHRSLALLQAEFVQMGIVSGIQEFDVQ